jgi:hypothetical protein
LSSERAQVTCEGVDVDFGSRGWAAKLLAIWVGIWAGDAGCIYNPGRVGFEREDYDFAPARPCGSRTREHVSRRVSDEDEGYGWKVFLYFWLDGDGPCCVWKVFLKCCPYTGGPPDNLCPSTNQPYNNLRQSAA